MERQGLYNLDIDYSESNIGRHATDSHTHRRVSRAKRERGDRANLLLDLGLLGHPPSEAGGVTAVWGEEQVGGRHDHRATTSSRARPYLLSTWVMGLRSLTSIVSPRKSLFGGWSALLTIRSSYSTSSLMGD